MALVVEDGTGLIGAESYCSVAFADLFHSNRSNFNWAGDETFKESALRRATDYMVQMYRTRWLGSRVSVTQALDWPRLGVVMEDVNAFASDRGYFFNVAGNVIPTQVMQACALLALKAIAFDDSGNPFDLAPDLERAVRREKVGTLEVEYEPGTPEYVRYRAIDQLLSIYLIGGVSGVRLVRG